MKIHLRLIYIWLILLCATRSASAQEVLNNQTVVEMTKAGLSKTIVITKINSAAGDYDVSAKALIELKKANVEDEIVQAMMQVFADTGKQNRNLIAETNPLPIVKPDANKTAAQLLGEARTIFFVKNSLYPSLSDLESSLLKRKGWQKFNLTITRNRDEADLTAEINHEFLSHYAFRAIDRKTGKVIAASGVTSFGGALSGNIAAKIIKRFDEVLADK